MSKSNTPKRILLVCLGNICRSPAGEAVMRHKAKQANLDIDFDSAGVADYHVGEQPDQRAIKVGKQLGYNLSTLVGRQIKHNDFYDFDIIFAMDNDNLDALIPLYHHALANANNRQVGKLQLFDPTGKSVADPYYGNEQDFVQMFAHLHMIADEHISRWINHQINH